MESRNTPKTPASFRKAAERAFRNANPEAAATSAVMFEWLWSRRVKWADGSAGFSGKLRVSAPGFRTREMIASFGQDAVTVR